MRPLGWIGTVTSCGPWTASAAASLSRWLRGIPCGGGLVGVLLLLCVFAAYTAWRDFISHPRVHWLTQPVRQDVSVLTPWLAPIVWEGTYEMRYVEQQYPDSNLTVALTVFAVGGYLRFLEALLLSAERHFMVGRRVEYYVMTDRVGAVPAVPLARGRRLRAFHVPRRRRWQDVSMARMEELEALVERHVAREADFVFCVDVDMEFRGRFGVEALGELVGVLHPWFYNRPRSVYTMETRPESEAFVPRGEWLYYFHGAVFGGRPARVGHLAGVCGRAIARDRERGVEAVWHDESHLNRYLVEHRPSKVLSPEYSWDENLYATREVQTFRLVSIAKSLSVREEGAVAET